MKNKAKTIDELRPEYRLSDFKSKGVRGRHINRALLAPLRGKLRRGKGSFDLEAFRRKFDTPKPGTSANAMKLKSKAVADEMRAEYNFDYTKGVRGKYYKRIQEEGTNVVLLDPDVQKAFPNSESVNDALRSILRAKRARRSPSGRASRRRAAA